MSSDTRVTMHKGGAALVAIALLAAGAGATDPVDAKPCRARRARCRGVAFHGRAGGAGWSAPMEHLAAT